MQAASFPAKQQLSDRYLRPEKQIKRKKVEVNEFSEETNK